MTDDKVVARTREHCPPTIDYVVDRGGDGARCATLSGWSSSTSSKPMSRRIADAATIHLSIRGDRFSSDTELGPRATERVALRDECGPGGPDAGPVADQGAPIATDGLSMGDERGLGAPEPPCVADRTRRGTSSPRFVAHESRSVPRSPGS
jgi:hypothetical protein